MSMFRNVMTGVAAFGATYMLALQISRYMMVRGLVKVTSTIDNIVYRVAPGPHMQDAADALARVRANLMRIYTLAIDSNPPQPLLQRGVQNLKRRYKSADEISLYELDPARYDGVAFNQNKSDGIFMCLRENLTNNSVATDETLMFIGIHELAHSMQSHTAAIINDGMTKHDDEFTAYNDFLIGFAVQLGILSGFRMSKRDHCGVMIGDTQTA